MERFRCSRNSSALMCRSAVTLRRVLARARPASSSNVRPMMQKPVQQRPVPAKTDLSLVVSSPNERNTLARLDGPQREALDCQETSCLNDAAAGNFHARSTASSAWITDNSIASVLTLVQLTTTATPPRARMIETIAAARAAAKPWFSTSLRPQSLDTRVKRSA